jgi:hypothetical protein
MYSRDGSYCKVPVQVRRFRTAEAIHRRDAQRIQVKERMIVCVISRFLALPVPRRWLLRAGLRELFNESMRENCA